MQRDLATLADRTFDLLVVGGGIHGAVAAWDAALRGLDVALVDRSDFGAGASANSLKIVHGGLRYLQTADFRRMRESIAERSTLLRIAPYLVRPLAFLVATHGLGKRGRPAMSVALALNDAIGFDRNRALAPETALPRGRLVSRRECIEVFPGFDSVPGTGGALWHDGQMRDSERLTLAFVLSAAELGATPANHVEVLRLLVRDGRVAGAAVHDREGGVAFEVRARTVLDARGGWGTAAFSAEGGRAPAAPRSRMALAVNLVCRRRFADVAVGLETRTPAERDPVCGGRRFVFLTPWRDSTLIGTTYRPWSASADALAVTARDLEVLLDECNEACPGLGLSPEEVTAYHRGLVPLKEGAERGRPEALAEETRVLDHGATDGLPGLVSLSGVKYTTARVGARQAVDLVCARLGRAPVPCRTAITPVYGGESRCPAPRDVLEARLFERYGARAAALSRRFAEDAVQGEPIVGGSPVRRGEVVHAVREEMAVGLGDVVRRTGLGAEACPSRAALEAASKLIAAERGWTEARRAREIDAVIDAWRPLVPSEVGP